MGRTPFDIADIVRLHRLGLEAAQPLSQEQGRALSAIALCRTAALGGHQSVCLECDFKADPSYNSCRNRNCPKCQALAQELWIATRAAAILPIPHFHGVFTLPEDFRALARQYPRQIYAMLFRCVIASLLEMARTRLGIILGLTLVLHTWTRELFLHPHVHVLISAGGLALDGSGFKRVKEKFLLHVKPLAKLFKKKMMAGLYASSKALAKAKAFLGPAPELTTPQPTWQEALLALTGVDVTRCRGCGAPIYHLALLPVRPFPTRLRSPIPTNPP